MFTGITQNVGSLTVIQQKNNQEMRLKVMTTDAFFKNVKLGDSIMLDGACLTVVNFSDYEAEFDIMIPTFQTTTIRTYHVGQKINLEKAMLASERFDGHFVLGHVDGVARIIEQQQIEDTVFLTISPCNQKLMKQIVTKGSVSISGVSLTVISATENSFQVGLIPLTRLETNLGDSDVGNEVNIETDILAKYLTKGE